MKYLVILTLLFSSFSAFSYEKTEGMCMTSNQENAWIKIEIFEASNETENTYAIKSEYAYEGELMSQVTIKGDAPDLSITKAVTEEGDNIFLVSYMVTHEDKKTAFVHYTCSIFE